MIAKIAAGDRLRLLLDQPEVRGSTGLRLTLEAWRQISEGTPHAQNGFPVYKYDDPRTGAKFSWGVAGLRPNGLTGFFVQERQSLTPRTGTWRIDHTGNVHRGTTWMVAHAHPRRRHVEELRDALRALYLAAPGSEDYELAMAEAGRILR